MGARESEVRAFEGVPRTRVDGGKVATTAAGWDARAGERVAPSPLRLRESGNLSGSETGSCIAGLELGGERWSGGVVIPARVPGAGHISYVNRP